MSAIVKKITVTCLTGLVAISALGSGMVLCLGDDGHVGVASPGKKECCSHEADTHGKCADEHDEASCSASSEDNCHGCVDMPIPQLQTAEVGSEARLSKALHHAIAVCADRCSSNTFIPVDYTTSPPLTERQITAFPGMTLVLRI